MVPRGGRRAGAGNVREAAAGGAREASDAELRRLEAPADDKPHTDQHLELAARAMVRVGGGAGPRKTSRWAVIGTKRRQFEREQPAVCDIVAMHGRSSSFSFHTINPPVILTQPAERCSGSE